MDPEIKPDKDAAHWSSRLKARAGEACAPTPAEDNKRWASRRRTGLSGLVYAANREAAIKVTVRDTSSSGALLQLVPGNESLTVDDIPERIRLVLRNNREYSDVECVVVRRYGDVLGVRYSSPFNTVVQKRATFGTLAGKRR